MILGTLRGFGFCGVGAAWFVLNCMLGVEFVVSFYTFVV